MLSGNNSSDMTSSGDEKKGRSPINSMIESLDSGNSKITRTDSGDNSGSSSGHETMIEDNSPPPSDSDETPKAPYAEEKDTPTIQRNINKQERANNQRDNQRAKPDIFAYLHTREQHARKPGDGSLSSIQTQFQAMELSPTTQPIHISLTQEAENINFNITTHSGNSLEVDKKLTRIKSDSSLTTELEENSDSAETMLEANSEEGSDRKKSRKKHRSNSFLHAPSSPELSPKTSQQKTPPKVPFLSLGKSKSFNAKTEGTKLNSDVETDSENSKKIRTLPFSVECDETLTPVVPNLDKTSVFQNSEALMVLMAPIRKLLEEPGAYGHSYYQALQQTDSVSHKSLIKVSKDGQFKDIDYKVIPWAIVQKPDKKLELRAVGGWRHICLVLNAEAIKLCAKKHTKKDTEGKTIGYGYVQIAQDVYKILNDYRLALQKTPDLPIPAITDPDDPNKTFPILENGICGGDFVFTPDPDNKSSKLWSAVTLQSGLLGNSLTPTQKEIILKAMAKFDLSSFAELTLLDYPSEIAPFTKNPEEYLKQHRAKVMMAEVAKDQQKKEVSPSTQGFGIYKTSSNSNSNNPNVNKIEETDRNQNRL